MIDDLLDEADDFDDPYICDECGSSEVTMTDGGGLLCEDCGAYLEEEDGE